MDEHDDDLESAVHEEATEETDEFPATGDELEEQVTDEADEDGVPHLDDDDAEI